MLGHRPRATGRYSPDVPQGSIEKESTLLAEPDFDAVVSDFALRLDADEPVDLYSYCCKYGVYAGAVRGRILEYLFEAGYLQKVRRPEVVAEIGGRPERIGPYRILDVLGEGGMGSVLLGEQREPVRRRVAIKVIRSALLTDALDGEEILARFEAERQTLALMDHDGIARLYEAGSTPNGLPYFVMEYVGGLPLNRHCDEHRLTAEARLALFVRVCEAVEHAHRSFLAGDPIAARRPSAWQRVGRFAERRRSVVAGVMVLAAAAVVVSFYGAQTARAEGRVRELETVRELERSLRLTVGTADARVPAIEDFELPPPEDGAVVEHAARSLSALARGASVLSDIERGRLFVMAGMGMLRVGRTVEARSEFEVALAYLREADASGADVAAAETCLGITEWIAGSREEARARLERVRRRLGESDGVDVRTRAIADRNMRRVSGSEAYRTVVIALDLSGIQQMSSWTGMALARASELDMRLSALAVQTRVPFVGRELDRGIGFEPRPDATLAAADAAEEPRTPRRPGESPELRAVIPGGIRVMKAGSRVRAEMEAARAQGDDPT